MPFYEYVCDNCGHEFEQLQSIKDEPLKKCPKCGKNKLSRLIGTGGGIIFKGSGFYKTDYKNSPSKQSSAKSDSSESAPVSDIKSESKQKKEKKKK